MFNKLTKQRFNAMSYDFKLKLPTGSIFDTIEINDGLFNVNYYESEFDDDLQIYEFKTVYYENKEDVKLLDDVIGYIFYGQYHNDELDMNVLLFGKLVGREKL